MTDDLVKRLRYLAKDIDAYESKAVSEAADRIEEQDKLILMAFGLLWHDKHNEARRLLADALSMDRRGEGIEMSRDYDDKYAPDEIPLPGPIGKAIEALEEAARQSQWWSVDEDNDTGWVKYSVASVMLTHWAAGCGKEPK
jgi:hypothetical protein